jgi:transposase
MDMKKPPDEKARSLKARGALHPDPKQVRDELFQQGEFFDPRDLTQVRYEMLRRHLADGRTASEAARAFGMSRQTFYLLAKAFQAEGMGGLLPKKRGPKRAHKCSEAMLEFLEARRQEAPDASWPDLAREVEQLFGVAIHPRTLQRRLALRRKKND